jgi:hypothetical protein
VLLPLGINYFNMFVINFLHKVELGVWRALFQHNLQILYAVSGNAVVELDKQWESIALTLYTLNEYPQIPRGITIWPINSSPLLPKCFRSEATSCSRLQRSAAGMSILICTRLVSSYLLRSV